MNGRERKDFLLGMPLGTAAHRMRKNLMFHMAAKLGWDTCFRCGNKILNPENLSIEHKISWQSAADPIAAFFDIDGLAFSHLKCNSGAASRPNKIHSSIKEGDIVR